MRRRRIIKRRRKRTRIRRKRKSRRSRIRHVCRQLCEFLYEYKVSLTLRRLMSYIYMEHPFLMFLNHTQRRGTVGRTPLEE